MRRYDIVIVGAGPAGSTAARLLDGRFSVAIVDKKGPKAHFIKPCGGLLAPDAQKIMASMGLNLPKEILVDPQIFAVRTIDLDSGKSRYYQRFYLNIDRRKFDRWLMEQIPSQVERIWGNCIAIEKGKNGYYLTIRREDGERESVFAARLIGADGAHSLVRRTFFPTRKIRRYTAIQQWFEQRDAHPLYSCFFDSENTDCYSWTVSKDGYFLYGGAFPQKQARERFERQKARLAGIGYAVDRPLRTEACEVLRPTGWRSFCCGKKDVFLAGEAAGMISPSSLEGISSALRSGAILAEALNGQEDRAIHVYRRRTRKLRGRLFFKLAKCPALYQPLLRRMVMASGLAAIKMCCDREENLIQFEKKTERIDSNRVG